MRTIPFTHRKIAITAQVAAIQTEGTTHMNVAKLLTDLPIEADKVETFVKGVEKLVNDAKASGLSAVTIADVEALVPEGEAVEQETAAVATDLGATL